ncbi:MAG: branched-chain amino acid aminotransferase [Lentisphaeria bacterium]
MNNHIDWTKLGFNYRDVNSHIRYVWRDGEWDGGELCADPHFNINIAATALHYGQTAFEGLKAFRCADGKVRLFRPNMNARRLQNSAKRIRMPRLSEPMFLAAVRRVIEDNMEYVPPYGSGGSLYVRPLLFGNGPQIGIHPAQEYVFIILVLPVGPYYQEGLKPVRAVILDEYDRAAPQGVGHVKVGGNYAASLVPHMVAMEKGFQVELYLDAKEHKYVEEFGTSNFIGIKGDDTFVTPESASILPSVMNDSLQKVAKDEGLKVERRPVPYDELKEFSEIGACGTAVVITPISEIVRGDEAIKVSQAETCGPVLQKLYNRVTAIQYGEEEDEFGWAFELADCG